jgi:hypothetical protein
MNASVEARQCTDYNLASGLKVGIACNTLFKAIILMFVLFALGDDVERKK